jgi:hypothetical protein
MIVFRFSVIFFVLLFSIFWTGFRPAQAEESPVWFSCEHDRDCVVVGAGCAIRAVNSSISTEADTHFKQVNARMDCAYPKKPSDFRAVCAHGKTACTRKKFFGLVEEIDHASTCVSVEKSCTMIPATP